MQRIGETVNSRTHYTYDDKGRASEYYCGLSGATGGTLGQTYAYTYDDTDNTLTTMTVEGENFNGDTLSYTYDALKRLSSKSVVGQYRTFAQNYIYKTLVGTRTSTLISGLNITLQGSSILLYTYSYDDLGNITGIYKDGVLAASYGYDDQGQLTSEIDHINDLQYIYVYDTYGNIRYVYKYTYSTATYLGTDTYGYTNTSWLDRLTSFNGANITYDAIGNPLSYNNGSAYTFTWQNGRELASVVKGGVTTTYKYGADGQRIEKKYGSTTYNYYYADGLLVRQTWGTHYIDFLYDESGSPYSLVYDGVQYYYVKNLQGDVVQIRSSYGTLLVEYTYDAWGNVLSITGSNASVLGTNNPIRYRSYYYDFETGFYYLQSRYYDPAIRRFINADGYVNANGDFIGFNMYAYCSNNPVIYADYSGQFIISAFATKALLVLGEILLSAIVLIATEEIATQIVETTTVALPDLSAELEKENSINEKHPGQYTVYALADSEGTVRYIGRTKKLHIRMLQHASPGSKTSEYHLVYYISGLTYTQARGIEEIGIRAYNTMNSGKNSIKGISSNNPNYDIYMRSAWDVLYNRVTNNLYGITEKFIP